MNPARRFDQKYQEQAVLEDGTRVLLRALGPDDGALLSRHFGALSPDSRYRRFLGMKNELSEIELSYFTHVDGEMHYALVAVLADRPSEPLGIARFIRSEDEPDVAEPAAAVVDSMQAHGLGRLMLMRLAEAAQERGVKHFSWVMMEDNTPIHALLRDVGHRLSTRHRGSTVSVELAL